jgi:plastocyanin
MKRFYCIILTLFFITTGSLKAATVTINFGGALGNMYQPNATTVHVGDVITWMGDFATHPLQSVSVPANAAKFGPINTGTSFSYTVTVAGNYGYRCNVHFASGMVGGFTAGASGVDQPIDVKLSMDPIFPNPAMTEAMVHFTLENPSHVVLRVYDVTGKLIRTAANEDMDAGFHMLTIDTKDLASGSYQYVLQAGDAVLRRAMIVVK